jgi:uncharacterized protein (TIGR03905 family)
MSLKHKYVEYLGNIRDRRVYTMIYKTKGTCSTQIDIEVEDGIIKSVAFTNGCNGNLQGVSRLVEGMKAEDAISKLRGIKCGFKNTSCPDQLSYAIEQAMQNA